MARTSNNVTGFVNFMTFLLSIPILAGGIWLSSKANQTDCLRFLQWPIIVVGAAIMAISLMGFAGSCYRISWILWLYLFCMFFVIAALFALVVFAFAVTSKGSGRPQVGRAYDDYYLEDYSGWLKDRVMETKYWTKISSCIQDARTCAKLRRFVAGTPEPAQMFYLRRINPIQSGCCKPPTTCGYTYVNETGWDMGTGLPLADPDCSRWSNDQGQLCYSCDSCKAGVLASIKKSWRKVSIINIVVLIILVIFYVIGCAAFRNNRRRDNDEPYGVNRMTKSQPARYHF